MLFQPPRCPNRGCPRHTDPEGRFYHRIGFYSRLCAPFRIQRYLCKTCDKSFSDQTFRVDYYDRRPHLNAQVFSLLASGIGLRQTGRLVGLGVHAVQRKFRKLGRAAGQLTRNLLARLPAGCTLQFDELETFEQKSIWPVSVGVLIDQQSFFIVDTTVASIRRGAKRGSRRQWAQVMDELLHGRRVDESRSKIRAAFGYLAGLLEGRPAVLHTDLKGAYVAALRGIFPKGQIQHVRTSGREVRHARNPLFPINFTHALMHERNGRLRCHTWLHSKLRRHLAQQLDLQAAWRNYCWRRFNRDDGNQTPAVMMRLLPRRLTTDEVVTWRQDWGERSIHPLSTDGRRTVRQAAA